jgi:hypothetical protein
VIAAKTRTRLTYPNKRYVTAAAGAPVAAGVRGSREFDARSWQKREDGKAASVSDQTEAATEDQVQSVAQSARTAANSHKLSALTATSATGNLELALTGSS